MGKNKSCLDTVQTINKPSKIDFIIIVICDLQFVCKASG